MSLGWLYPGARSQVGGGANNWCGNFHELSTSSGEAPGVPHGVGRAWVMKEAQDMVPAQKEQGPWREDLRTPAKKQGTSRLQNLRPQLSIRSRQGAIMKESPSLSLDQSSISRPTESAGNAN